MVNNTFKGYLLVSDLDGTLMDMQLHTAQRNIDAINRFMEKGGLFTLATGRHIGTAKRLYEQFNANAPAILLNGCLLYDFQNSKPIFEKDLGKNSGAYIKAILNKFQGVGCMINAGKSLYIVKDSKLAQKHLKVAAMDYVFSDIDDVDTTWYKALFLIDDANMVPNVRSYAEKIAGDDVRFVKSLDNYIEMLPSGINKSIPLNALVKYLDIDRNKVCAIGDYDNDKELLSFANISAAPCTSPDYIKDMVDVVVGTCEHGAVADFIEWLEERIEK